MRRSSVIAGRSSPDTLGAVGSRAFRSGLAFPIVYAAFSLVMIFAQVQVSTRWSQGGSQIATAEMESGAFLVASAH